MNSDQCNLCAKFKAYESMRNIDHKLLDIASNLWVYNTKSNEKQAKYSYEMNLFDHFSITDCNMKKREIEVFLDDSVCYEKVD